MKLHALEHPLPRLTVDISSLSIETKNTFSGKFYIKNTGGGKLFGEILTRCPGLTVNPAKWDGNRQTIEYTWDAKEAGLSSGEFVEGRFFITSSGGESEIPVTAKLAKMVINTPCGRAIANIQDFYDFAMVNLSGAKKLFTESDFYMLLMATGYKYLEVYESLHKDANRERAMDNFFILSGLKGRTKLTLTGKTIEFQSKPYEDDLLYGRFKIDKDSSGYVEAMIDTEGGSPWLTLSKNRLTSADFENNSAFVNFSVNPLKIESSYARELIRVGENLETVDVIFRRLPPVIFKLNKDSYKYEDTGSIHIINNTGANIQTEVFCPDGYIRFSARRYAVGSFGEIPFAVKLSPFLNAQKLFRKLPFMKTVIEIKATQPGEAYRFKLPVIVGDW